MCLLSTASLAAAGQAVTLVPTSTRFAGTAASGFSGDFGSATSIALNQPSYVVQDTLGNQFISDTGNNCVRRIDASGNISTVAGLTVASQGDTCNTATNTTPTSTQGLYKPSGLAIDGANNLYIADAGHNCVRRLASGTVNTANLVTVAGTCTTTAALSATPAPSGIAVNSTDDLYISTQDTEILPIISNYQVLKHTNGAAVGTLCVVAGNASLLVPTTCTGSVNGVTLSGPSGLALDINGNLFVADTGNNCVRQVLGNTTAPSTFVGRCTNDGSGSASTALFAPFGLVQSLIQSLYITESGMNNVVKYASGTGTLSVVAGLPNGTAGSYTAAQDGVSALNIPLNTPRGISLDVDNNFYVVDSSNSIVRDLSANTIFPATPVGSQSATQAITFTVNQSVKLAMTLGPDYSATSNTCTGSLTAAAAGAPPNTCQIFVRFSPTRPGNRNSPLKLADSTSSTSVVQGLQGVGTGPLGIFAPGNASTVASSLAAPKAIATDSAGNAYVLEGGKTAGTADVLLIPAGGGATSVAIPHGTNLVNPIALAGDAAGDWFIADAGLGTVSRFGADGSVNTSYITGLVSPSAVFVDGFGNVYIAQQGTAHNVIEVYASGPQRVIAGSGTDTAANGVPSTNAKFVSPGGLTMDVNGVLYIADTGGHRVYAVDSTGLIHTLAGNGTTTTTTAGVALSTALLAPAAIATDAAADVYVADQGANRVYSIYAASASGTNISSVLGTGTAGYSGDGGPSVLAQINGPLSVAIDSSSIAYIVDGGNNAVRSITYPSPTINFGTVMLNTTSAPKLQYFGNVGTNALNLTSALSTTNSVFSVDTAVTTCGLAILPGAVCDVGFTFTPTAAVAYTATSSLISNSYNSPEVITLKGNGTQLIVLTLAVTPPTEIYGQAFPISTNLSTGAGVAATGTLTYTVNGVTICTSTGTLGGINTCNAASTGLPVGTYTVTVTYSGDTNYGPVTTTTTLTVVPAPLTVVGGTLTKVYGQPNPTLTGTLTGVASTDTILVAYSTTATTSSPVGVYPITATLTPVGTTSLSNYTVTNTPGTLTITKAPLTLLVTSVSRQYGLANPTLTGTPSGVVNGDTFTYAYSTTATPSSPVGTYTINGTVTGANSADYTITVTAGTLTITPAPLTLTVASASRPYGTANPTFTGSLTGTLYNGDTLTPAYSTTATIASYVGTYPITGTVTGSAAPNYSVTVVPGTLTITKATTALVVTANNATRLYGAANPTFTGTTTGALNGDTFTISYTTSATVTSPIGTYSIVPTVSGAAAANYNITTGNGTLTITPAPLSVTANNVSRPYGSANPTLTGTTTGLLNGDTITTTFTTTATVTSPVGTYAIVTTATGAALSNYVLTTANGTLTVTPATAAVTITVASVSRYYGAANPTLTGTITGALNGDSLGATYSTTATISSFSGIYPITAMLTGAAAANYTAIVIPGTFTITPAPTGTVVTTSSSPASPGASVTFTATVSSLYGIPGGTVNFFDGTTSIGPGTLNASGVATLTTSALSLGSHNIVATYVASTNFQSSTGTVNQNFLLPAGAFLINATPPSQIVRGAGTTIYNVVVSSTGPFAGPVALTCSGLPADATCSFASPTVTLTALGAVNTTMTVTNTAADAKLDRLPHLPNSSISATEYASIFPIGLAGMGFLLAGLKRKKLLNLRKIQLMLALLFTLGVIGLTGCGCPNSAYRTYTITITGTSVAGIAPSQATAVNLSVGLQ